MTNEQLGAFFIANVMTIGFLLRWVVNRAIDYTHLQRDVKELKEAKTQQDVKNEKVQTDMKGLSIKIDKIKG